ncbi:hypothetical protein LV779_07970 [Streptomyces thinghirensis]|nr:hypothetical protein [Streptomyces thinghirensis]
MLRDCSSGRAPRRAPWTGCADCTGSGGRGWATSPTPSRTHRQDRHPCPGARACPLTDAAGWVNVELTKNVAEIGLPRILHGARNAPR